MSCFLPSFLHCIRQKNGGEQEVVYKRKEKGFFFSLPNNTAKKKKEFNVPLESNWILDSAVIDLLPPFRNRENNHLGTHIYRFRTRLCATKASFSPSIDLDSSKPKKFNTFLEERHFRLSSAVRTNFFFFFSIFCADCNTSNNHLFWIIIKQRNWNAILWLALYCLAHTEIVRVRKKQKTTTEVKLEGLSWRKKKRDLLAKLIRKDLNYQRSGILIEREKEVVNLIFTCFFFLSPQRD